MNITTVRLRGFSNAKRYDTFPATLKIFTGEYASHYSWDIDGTLRNNWIAALSGPKAAYMTGLERNADVVKHGIVCAFVCACGWLAVVT